MVDNNLFNLDAHRDRLHTEHWSAGKTGPVRKKRKLNINWIQGRDFEELEYGTRERQILVTETSAEEQLLLQYPGKESQREEDASRPWDFRPKIQFADGTYGPDLSFGDVWDALFEELEALGDDGIEPARALAALFYRMAFMVDHRRIYEPEFETRPVGGSDVPLDEFESRTYPSMMIYEPPNSVVDPLANAIPQIAGMTIEAFLHYNDILAWNEDCKYYFRDTNGGDGEWHGPRTGRINNLLTHVSILGIITGDLRLSSVLNKFQRGGGVGPVTRTEAEAITDGILGERSPDD